jgi:ribonuclease H / adenosylcobalamin/alpha-ribazole phosphatase
MFAVSTAQYNIFFFFLFPGCYEMRIYLVRHGSHGDVGVRLTGRGGGGLTDAGRAEAAAAAAVLAGRGVAAIWSSPQARTRETAAIVGAACGVPVRIADALDEIDFGDWTGRRFDALAGDPAWDAWNARRGTAMPPGGETMAAATARAVRFVEELASHHPLASGEVGKRVSTSLDTNGAVGPVACVSHCDVIRGVVAHYLGLSLDNLLRFEIAPASITTLDLWPGGATLVELNRV